MQVDPNPSGLCHCGCGRRTPVASRTDRTRGAVRGCHRRFVVGHGNRVVTQPAEKVCGKCGQKKPIKEFASTSGLGRARRCVLCEREAKNERRRAQYAQLKAAGLVPPKPPNTPEQTAMSTELSRQWRNSNRERYRQNMRRAKLLRKVGKNELSREYAEILLGDPCSYCGSTAGSIDHIEPVSAGGSNEWPNLTSSCLDCNRCKTTRPLLIFLAVR